MKCLEKEPARRYETCNAIANDIIRHLGSEPVMARPISNAYRLRKLVSRNRLLVGAVAGVMLALLMGTATSTRFYLQEEVALKEAQDALKEVQDAKKRAEDALKKAQDAKKQAEDAKKRAEDAEQKAREIRERGERQVKFFEGTQILRDVLPPSGKRAAPRTSVNDPGATNKPSSQRPLQTGSEPLESYAPPSVSAPLYFPPTSVNNAPGAAATTNSVVVSPQEHREAYIGWAREWWKWMMELPITDELTGAEHPVMDSPRFDPRQRQRSDIWFLASPFGTVEREVAVPNNVYLYIGMLNAESSDLEAEDSGFYGETPEERGAISANIAEHIVDFFVAVDGVEVENWESHRISSPDVEFTAPTPWIYGDYGGEGLSSGDGYFLMLTPLPPGIHTVYYRGAFQFTVQIDGFDGYYVIEMTYRLIVPE
jgi:hypothetical protein